MQSKFVKVLPSVLPLCSNFGFSSGILQGLDEAAKMLWQF